jgi:tRNA1Val (adenine37-N6)-methyltransferase
MAHNAYFQFKQFRIEQQRAAMKVGTDGVLLGAWCRTDGFHRALDIGSGTGLLSLMLAQRNPTLHVDAIDIDEGAYLDTRDNFEASSWNQRLNCEKRDLKQISAENHRKYDLIVCNPPFFRNSVKSVNPGRKLARHTDSLPNEELIGKVALLLSLNGFFNVVLPVTEERNFCNLASWERMFPRRITRVKPNPDYPPVRVLMEFGFESILEEEGTLSIETNTRHVYTEEFKGMVKNFYLNL